MGEERFTEDGLRPIRAIRFSSQLNFKVEDKTYEAIMIPNKSKKTKIIILCIAAFIAALFIVLVFLGSPSVQIAFGADYPFEEEFEQFVKNH